MSENIVSEKMKRSVYQDYPDYKDEPFSTSKKFGVYIPKLNDQVSDLIDRHETKQQKLRNSSAAPGRPHEHNIFSSSYNGAGQNSAPIHGDNLFSQSIRSNGCNHCNPAVSPQGNAHDGRGYFTQELCPCCKNSSHCCCRSNFRIRRSNSKCDSAYSHDTNTWKTKLHGTRFGYYQNRPYTQIGSDFAGSRYYKDHPEYLSQGGPLNVMNHARVSTANNFENRLITDSRTGQKYGKRSMNPVMNNLLRESHKFKHNPLMQEGILKLKEVGSLNLPAERIKRNKPTLEKGYVHNDFHSKESKNGYGRTVGGRALV